MGTSDSGPVPPRARGPRHGRWWHRIAIVLVFVVLGFAVLALGLFPQEPLRRFTEKRMREAFGPESRMGYLHVVPGTLSVLVEDLEIDAPGAPRPRAGETGLRRSSSRGSRLTARWGQACSTWRRPGAP